MTSIVAPPVSRPFVKTYPINSASRDYTTEDGVRISFPCYIDCNLNQRKELLNGVRQACYQPSQVEATRSVSGITVENSSTRQAEVEAFIGMSIDVLRSVLFSRGGLAADLLFKLQAVTGIEFVSDKDITAAFKQRQAQVKECKSSLTFN